MEKSGGGGIRLSKHRAGAAAEAHRESREEGGGGPIEDQMKEECDDGLVVSVAAPAVPMASLKTTQRRRQHLVTSQLHCSPPEQC